MLSQEALASENKRIADEAAEFIHRELSALKGTWAVHPNAFLPANVECDHGGRVNFDAILSRHVLAAIQKAQINVTTIEVSSVALKLLNDLHRTGLYGATPEEAARRLVEEGLRQRIADGTIKPI